MPSFIKKKPVLSEIGLDSSWPDVQRRVFGEQLGLAEELHKPIVLHTKGMEKKIAEMIEPYTMCKSVHWYSCMEHLELYLEQDFFFTLGPDYAGNTAVGELIRHAPLNRLLTETDRLSAVEWALGRRVAPEEIESVLR